MLWRCEDSIPLIVVIDGLSGGKVVWHHSSQTVGFVDVKDGVRNLSQGMFMLLFLWINGFFDNLSLFISKVI